MTGPGPIVPQIRTPERWTPGVYANGMGCWFSQTEFTLDFFCSLPNEQGQDPQGNQVVVAPQEVVARVKLPPPLVFQIMRNLADTLDKYEKQFGKVPDHQGQTFGTDQGGG